MAGLVPKRRTHDELTKANSDLLDRHKEHLRSWVSEKTSSSETKRDRPQNAADQKDKQQQ